MNSKDRRKKPRETLSPFGEMGRAHGSSFPESNEPRPNRIGIYCEGGDWIFFNPYFGRIFSGIAQAAEKAGSRIVMYLPEAGRGEKGYKDASRHELGFGGLSQLKEGLVQGAILVCGRPPSPAQAKEIRSLKIPVVLLSNNENAPGFFQLNSGVYDRSYLCAEQLYVEGRKKVGMIGLYEKTSYHHACLRALKAASKKAKREFKDEQFQAMSQWDLAKPHELQTKLDQLIKMGCDGIICSEAFQALVALDILAKQKIKMPKELCLISFGPLPRSARVGKGAALRLLQVDLPQEGHRVFGMLQDAIKGMPPRTESIRWSWPGY